MGSKKNAIWRVVVADGRSPRDGRFIEMIGHYNPQTEPSQIVIDKDRLQHWLDRGAQPSNTVRKLMRAETSGGGAATAVAEEPPAAGAPEEPAADGDAPAGADAEGAAGAAAGAVEPAEQPDADSADAAPESGAESG